ncbi:MAG: hypothetical protein HY940_10160 [Gammaproteobacteria bacterium]|nr:hypothetical protein [Gammaproteobacteria bacterium]
MNKKLIALAVAAAVTGGVSVAQAADVTGFAAAQFTVSDDTATNESAFHPTGDTLAEVDVAAKGVRIDVDTSAGGDLNFEQANVTTDVGPASLTVGVFNSNIGLEKQDVNERSFIETGLAFNHIATQNAINLTGANVGFKAGPAAIGVALVNDPTFTPAAGESDKTSFGVSADFDVAGVGVGVDYLTQDSTAVGNILDLSLTYSMGALGLNFEMVNDDAVDSLYQFGGTFDAGNGITVAARYGMQTNAATGSDDQTKLDLAVSYALADNVDVSAEYSSYDDGSTAGTTNRDVTLVGVVASF